MAAHFQRSVDVVEGGVGHVARHPDARGRNHVVSVFQMGRELFDPAPEEEVVMLAVEATLTDSVEEVFADIKCMQIGKARVLQ